MNVPKLRFKEFNDEWCYQSLSKYVNRITTKNKNNESDLVLTISAQYGLVDQTIFFNRSVSSSNLTGYYLLNNGDFAYNKSYSNGYPWGAVKRLNKYNQGVVSSLYICFKTNNLIDSNFLEQYFETNKWYQQISEVSVEGARNHGLLNIAVNDFFNTKHYIPSIKEQEKISKFLSLLDKKIELQSKKIEDLKLFKLYLQNKLYNANDTKDVLIKDLGEIVTGTTPSKSENKYWDNGNILWITPTDICENRDINDCSCKLTESGLAKGRFIPKNSILVTCIASIGKNAIIKEDGSCNQQINAIIPSKDYNYNYIYYMIENLSNYMKSIAGTSATAIINKEQFGNINIKIHKREVQDKISKILNAFETKIIQEGFKYKKLQNLKKGLMQNMFV